MAPSPTTRPTLAHVPRSTPAPSFASARSPQTSTKTAQPLANRLLFPSLPPGTPPPPLFTTPCPPELTADAYDLIALALRAHVAPWWSKITRYDKEFLPAITSTLAAVLQALQARVHAADVPQLLYATAPALLAQHWRDWREAQAKAGTGYTTGAVGGAARAQVFHGLQPHVALDAQGNVDVEYIRQAVDGVLRLCLPPQDYAPPGERYIVREIVVMIVLRVLFPRLTEPWFIDRILLNVLGPPRDSVVQKATDPSPASSPSPWSFANLIVFVLSAVQAISAAGLAITTAYRQAKLTISRVNGPSRAPSPAKLQRSRSAPATPTPPGSVDSSFELPHPPLPRSQPRGHARQCLRAAAEIINARTRLTASLLIALIDVPCTLFESFADRFLAYMLTEHVLSAPTLHTILLTTKRTVFPPAPAQPEPPPTAAEQAHAHAQLVARLVEAVPRPASALLFGARPGEGVEEALEALSDRAANAHLLMMFLDAVLVALFPEMGGEVVGVSDAGAGETYAGAREGSGGSSESVSSG
ncbi:hypothetical protein CONPUDRAFT_133921 [Coniophora puteana RWD-64-598 SS2]|uniref:PXA domain-containing protein n=1 Tax=Coniophora puteana (strain RWD-64-598) TaxID=741705 RepID=A0A5M3N505_CONPW|nr:uncharacterized protein CONPUDRAFT_133921 [Coniophora puteana RWD-64-598 SS2]EIW86502.1 hypothetical protein CONPUDRAFT_133921 [Coniophora puteana RWD-64-598 SS2]